MKHPHFLHCFVADIKYGHCLQIEYLSSESFSPAYSVVNLKKSNGLTFVIFLLYQHYPQGAKLNPAGGAENENEGGDAGGVGGVGGVAGGVAGVHEGVPDASVDPQTHPGGG